MRRRDARRQIGKERRDLGGDAEAAHSLAHAREILVARLLRDARAASRSDASSCSIAGGTISDMMRAPWLPPNTSSRSGPSARGARYGVAAAAITAGRTGLPVRVALAASAGSASSTPSKVVAIAVTRGASSRLARPITAFCSWMTVGIPAGSPPSSGGTVG